MGTHTIVVANASGFAKAYVVFMQGPVVNGRGGPQAVSTNAWVSFDTIRDGGHAIIEFTDLVFAYWTTAKNPLGAGTTFEYGGTAAVDAAQMHSISFIGQKPAGFEKPTSGGLPDSFRITGTSDFDKDDQYLFGVAKLGSIPGVPSAVATFIAQPNETYDITPATTYYVADYACVVGDIIDEATIAKACAIDLKVTSQKNAVVTQALDGVLTARYY